MDSKSKRRKPLIKAFFHFFKTTDLSGQTVDETMFKNHVVTVLNFWFNGCPACVEEMPALEALNKEWLAKDATLVGVNVEFARGEEIINEAKQIIADKGAAYTNIGIDPSSDAQKLINQLNAFPTFIVVDRNGNIVGEPIVGALAKGSASRQILMERVEQVIEKDNQSK